MMPHHNVFDSVFTPNKLSIGIFLPLEINKTNLTVYDSHIKHIKRLDSKGFPMTVGLPILAPLRIKQTVHRLEKK